MVFGLPAKREGRFRRDGFLDPVDITVAEGVGDFRHDASFHGCAGGQRDQNDAQILVVAKMRFCHHTKFSDIIFRPALLQRFRVAVSYGGNLPHLLVIRIVSGPLFLIFENDLHKMFLYGVFDLVVQIVDVGCFFHGQIFLMKKVVKEQGIPEKISASAWMK